jgi:hypothetical protein
MLPVLLTGCLTVTWNGRSSNEAGCVTYRNYKPAVMSTDAAETKRSFLKLDIAMNAACD